MKTNELLDMLHRGYEINWDTDARQGAWICIPKTYVIHITRIVTRKAIKHGYIKREIDGQYTVTRKGLKKLKQKYKKIRKENNRAS